MLLNILKRVEPPKQEEEEEVAPWVLKMEVAAGGGEELRGPHTPHLSQALLK
jgi:hypothetical protein